MNKTKALGILTIALILINGIMLSWIVFNNNSKHLSHKKRHHGPKELVIKQLNFSEEQIALYEQSINRHRQAVDELEPQIRAKKRELYASLSFDNSNISANDSNELKQQLSQLEKDQIILGLSQLQIQMENVHYTHFEEIKSICEDAQVDKFNALTKELARFFAPQHKKHPKRK